MTRILFFIIALMPCFFSYTVQEVISTGDDPASRELAKRQTEALKKQEALETAKVKQAQAEGDLYIPGLGTLGGFYGSSSSSKKAGEGK